MSPGDEPYHSESERISSEISLIPLIKNRWDSLGVRLN